MQPGYFFICILNPLGVRWGKIRSLTNRKEAAVPPTLTTTKAHELSARVFRPIVTLLYNARVEPNTVTLLGLLLAFGAGVTFGMGAWWVTLILLLLNGFGDMLDGELSRRMPDRPHHLKQFGTFLDPAVDRFADSALFLGAAAYCMPRVANWITLAICTAGFANIISSWMRAKIESMDRKLVEKRPLTRATLHVQLMATVLFAGIFPEVDTLIVVVGLMTIVASTLWTCSARAHRAWQLFQPNA